MNIRVISGLWIFLKSGFLRFNLAVYLLAVHAILGYIHNEIYPVFYNVLSESVIFVKYSRRLLKKLNSLMLNLRAAFAIFNLRKCYILTTLEIESESILKFCVPF